MAPSSDLIPMMEKGLWSSWNKGAFLPLRAQGRLVGALLLQQGAPARQSGPVWSLLEAFLIKVLVSTDQDLAANPSEAPSSSNVEQKLRAFTEKFRKQGRYCCLVSIRPPLSQAGGQFLQEIDKLKRVFPEESELLSDGKTIYAVFASAYEIDIELYQKVLSRALKESNPDSAYWELHLEVMAPESRALP